MDDDNPQAEVPVQTQEQAGNTDPRPLEALSAETEDRTYQQVHPGNPRGCHGDSVAVVQRHPYDAENSLMLADDLHHLVSRIPSALEAVEAESDTVHGRRVS